MKNLRAYWLLFLVMVLILHNLTGCYEQYIDPTASFPNIPDKLSTKNVSLVNMHSAVSGGSVGWGGRAPVTGRGVYYGTSPNPIYSGNRTSDGTGMGGFTSTLSGLETNTKYYIRSYATNSYGTGYGNEISFTTLPDFAIVETSFIINFTDKSADVGGTVVHEGVSKVIESGIFWSLSPFTETSGTMIKISSGAGSFLTSLYGLIPNTIYYVKAYAIDDLDTVYGNQYSFTTRTDKITDVDGNNYYTQTIGNQVWMAENLKTSKYADGSSISLVKTNAMWGALAITANAYCWYDDSIKNKEIYGALYNWSAAMNLAAGSSSNPSGVRGVCPAGWHMPSEAEWKELEDFLGGRSKAQGKMKEPGTTHWMSPNTDATNESGFSALPGGYRGEYGTFGGYDAIIGTIGIWWSSTESYPPGYTLKDLAFAYSLTNKNDPDFGQGYLKRAGCSVRCVKDK